MSAMQLDRAIQQAEEYVSRLPSPPVVETLLPDDKLLGGWTPPLVAEYIFMEGITLTSLGDRILASQNWSFTDRRRAQRILPFLYLGPNTCSRDENFLREEAVTKIVSMSHMVPRLAGTNRPGAAAELGIDVQNAGFFNPQRLAREFSTLIKSINSHLEERRRFAIVAGNPALEGRVLVCCATGNDLSATLVVAYLMETLHMTLAQAAQFVNQQRFSVDFNQSLRVILQAYEGILQARRAVIHDHGQRSYDSNLSMSVLHPVARSSKRRMDDVDSMDTEDDDEPADVARFRNRNFAPFV